jgi:7-cyano-7-deazaguanine synthase
MTPIKINLNSILESTFSLYANQRDQGVVEDQTGFEFYTPSRNLLFSTIAAVVGEVAAISKNIKEIKIGLGIHKHSDNIYSKGDYWDITPEFANRLNKVFELNDCVSVSLYSPYADQTKEAIVRDAITLGVPYKLTWTCYDPVQVDNEYRPCLKCEACLEREQAGERAGILDINDYVVSIGAGS